MTLTLAELDELATAMSYRFLTNDEVRALLASARELHRMRGDVATLEAELAEWRATYEKSPAEGEVSMPAPPRRQHRCHALNCQTPCAPERLFCYRHWAMTPAKLQRAVWATYRRGQCDDKDPSEAWHVAADAAIAAVALREGCPPGKLRVPMVRAVLELAPELFGKDEKKMRKGLQTIDRKKTNVASLTERSRKGDRGDL